jgi:uncharacterized protein YjbI with pentapeptide repeats
VSDAASGKGRKAEMTNSKPPSDSEGRQDDGKWYDRTRYQVLLFAVGIVLFGLVLGVVLDWYINPRTATQKKDLVQALALITAGVAGAVGIFFTWRGQRITEESLETTRNLTSEGQITERFTHAIDHLGDTDDDGQPRLEVRLGGIYALERIARDSPERDYTTVVDILTAYVRKNAARRPKDSSRSTSVRDVAHKPKPEAEDIPTPVSVGPPRVVLRTLSADIQAILDVLMRLEEDRTSEKGRVQLDLRNTDLGGAYLTNPHYKANLQGAILQAASLKEGWIQSANLQDANLQEADLRGASFMHSDLRDASLRGADLRGADFMWADLRKAALEEADLRGAHLQEVNLQGADLEAADLKGANLEAVYLHGADLQGAYLRRANLQGAHLREAFLEKAKLTESQLAATLSLEGATMPDCQKYEDWIKDKGGNGEDTENE